MKSSQVLDEPDITDSTVQRIEQPSRPVHRSTGATARYRGQLENRKTRPSSPRSARWDQEKRSADSTATPRRRRRPIRPRTVNAIATSAGEQQLQLDENTPERNNKRTQQQNKKKKQ